MSLLKTKTVGAVQENDEIPFTARAKTCQGEIASAKNCGIF